MNIFSRSNRELHYPHIGKNYSIDCPPHTLGYGTVVRWGYIDADTKVIEWLNPGEPNERIFPDYNTGKLWWSTVTRDDILESRRKNGARCILVNGDDYAFSNYQELWTEIGCKYI